MQWKDCLELVKVQNLYIVSHSGLQETSSEMILSVLNDIFQLIAVIQESFLAFFAELAYGEGDFSAVCLLDFDIASRLEFREV